MNHANANEISCRQALALVADYLDRELAPFERKLLELHLETCHHCYDRVEFERLLKARLARLQTVEISEPLRQKIECILDQY
jgi:hypothetical protein